MIFLGSDHAGFALKEVIKKQLDELGLEFQDFGTHSDTTTDYPDYVHPLCQNLEKTPYAKGILICGSGNGVCMTANKYSFIRAALVWLEELAVLARQHNDANVICLPSRFMTEKEALAAVIAFLETPFEGGRHQTRVNKISI